MDDTLRFLLSFAIPGLGFAVLFGVMKTQVGQLQRDSRKRETEFDAFKEAERARSHELNLQLASSLGNVSVATKALVDFEQRRGEQIDRNTYRSRTNRNRIVAIEKQTAKVTARRLREHGIPADLIEDTSDVMERAAVESSGAHAASSVR